MIGQILTRLRASESARFVLFLAVGALNTAVNYLVFAALVFAGVAAGVAVAMAFAVGIVFNFFTTGRVVFDSLDARRLPRFILVYAVQLLANLALLHLATAAGLNVHLAQAAILAVLAVATFGAMRFFVFR